MNRGMDNLKINISNLKDGQHEFDFKVTPEEINFDNDETELTEELNVKANIYKAGNQITVDTRLEGKFKFVCDRCLENYDHEFDNRFEIFYKTDFKGTEKNDESDDIKFISPNVKFIDLKDDVRDYVMLSVPMKKAPAEVNGVCEYCHKNIAEILNLKKEESINPVWEKLLKTKKLNK